MLCFVPIATNQAAQARPKISFWFRAKQLLQENRLASENFGAETELSRFIKSVTDRNEQNATLFYEWNDGLVTTGKNNAAETLKRGVSEGSHERMFAYFARNDPQLRWRIFEARHLRV